jgi:hypothetical protein
MLTLGTTHSGKMSVEHFMENGGKILKVHILKKINGSNYIGGDDSKLVHIKQTGSNFGELEEENSYSFIKPQKENENTVTLNPKFKPSKVNKIETSKTKIDADVLETQIVIEKQETDGDTLETIEKKCPKSKISKMTVKCISVSRIIQTAYGEYRIAKIRDTENNKGDINLNKHCKNKMEVDQIYHLENIKTSDYKNEDSEFRRLSTIPITIIRQVNKMEETKFSHMTLGDEKARGSCVGIGKVFAYYGCKNCWKKVEPDAQTCVRCNKSTEDKSMEFSAELYIDIEDEVMTAQGFKRQFPGEKIETVDEEEITEILENRIVGKNIELEYNEGEKNEEIKLIKIRKIES